MRSVQFQWWKKRKHLMTMIGIITSVVVFIVLIFIGYQVHGSAGFGDYYYTASKATTTGSSQSITTTQQYQTEKSLWDWLQLLIVPAVIAVGGLVFNQVQHNREQRATEQRNERERMNASKVDPFVKTGGRAVVRATLLLFLSSYFLF